MKEKIQPYLGMGGDIDVLEIGEDGRVKVVLKGTCAGCAMAMYTLKGLVEDLRERYRRSKNRHGGNVVCSAAVSV